MHLDSISDYRAPNGSRAFASACVYLHTRLHVLCIDHKARSRVACTHLLSVGFFDSTPGLGPLVYIVSVSIESAADSIVMDAICTYVHMASMWMRPHPLRAPVDVPRLCFVCSRAAQRVTYLYIYLSIDLSDLCVHIFALPPSLPPASPPPSLALSLTDSFRLCLVFSPGAVSLRKLMDGTAVGLHSDIEVTCSNWGQVDRSNPDQRVTQVCCEVMSMSRAGALN